MEIAVGVYIVRNSKVLGAVKMVSSCIYFMHNVSWKNKGESDEMVSVYLINILLIGKSLEA